MTQADENMAQITQLHALSAARNRVLEVYGMMVPVVEKLAVEGDPLARYLLGELDRANTALQSENMSAAEFVEESNG